MISRENLKTLFLRHSENSANDAVRQGLISLDDHAVLIDTLRASRREWDRAKDYLRWRVYHGFLTQQEADLALSACAEYSPSYND